MNKPFSEWTLKEVQEMCKDTACRECLFAYPDMEHTCKLTFRSYERQDPCNWELEENDI